MLCLTQNLNFCTNLNCDSHIFAQFKTKTTNVTSVFGIIKQTTGNTTGRKKQMIFKVFIEAANSSIIIVNAPQFV